MLYSLYILHVFQTPFRLKPSFSFSTQSFLICDYELAKLISYIPIVIFFCLFTLWFFCLVHASQLQGHKDSILNISQHCSKHFSALVEIFYI